MALSEWAYHQKFKTKDGTRLVSLRSHPCAADTKERYILWSDVQHAFKSIDHLETKNEERIFFMIDADGELYGLVTNECVVYLLSSFEAY